MPKLRLTLIVALLCSLFLGIQTQAQQNLLNDPGFEGQYTGRGRGDFNIPSAWGGWWTDTPKTEAWMNVEPIAFPHPGANKRSGSFSANFGRGSGTFTGAIYQQVANIPAGSNLTATAWVYIENKAGNGAQARIGIGNATGGNPFGDVVWGPWVSQINSWQQLSVQGQAKGGEVTVFIYMTQTWPNDPNQYYMDDASLVITGQGAVTDTQSGTPTGDTGTTTGGNTGGSASVAPSNVVPFVNAQSTRDDGSIIHVVQGGDTLYSIAVAYGVPASEIKTLNNISNNILMVGQELLIREASKSDDDKAVESVAQLPTRTVKEATQSADGQSSGDSGSDSESTAVPTEKPTDASTPEPTDIPTETPIPYTPTPVPTAPVKVADTASGDPSAVDSIICFVVFNDLNQNRIQDPDETFVSGGEILFNDANGVEFGKFTSDEAEPRQCLETLPPGDYVANASSPAGFGLTTPGRLNVKIQPGTRNFELRFGVAEGLQVAQAPTPDQSDLQATPQTISETVPVSNPLLDNIGLILMVAAALVLVVGGGIAFFLLRR
ncbi:hypothetical protein MASR2M15_25170 [Anaerolineales bacterium]